jgi:hypothetical protein
MPLEFSIRPGQSIVVARYCIAKMASSDIDVQHFTAEVFQSTIGGMERTFHVAHQCLQTRLEQLTFHYAGGQFCPDHFAALWTDKAVQTVFSNSHVASIEL